MSIFVVLLSKRFNGAINACRSKTLSVDLYNPTVALVPHIFFNQWWSIYLSFESGFTKIINSWFETILIKVANDILPNVKCSGVLCLQFTVVSDWTDY